MLVKNKNLSVCTHCGDSYLSQESESGSLKGFCCSGCEVVYDCIHNSGLDEFYDLLDTEKIELPKVALSAKEYEYLKNPSFIKEFSRGNRQNQFQFYIQGIECMACSWIFNNLSQLHQNVEIANFLPESNILNLSLKDSSVLFDVINFIARLGYKAVPLKNTEEAESYYLKEQREDLIRIGATGFLWMNIMLYSISIYSGATNDTKYIFNIIQSLLFIPLFVYSAQPFYKNVLSGLKRQSPSLDFPIVISIVLGTALSYYSFFTGGDKLYFDSISMFIFLILGTRYLLKSLLRKEVATDLFECVYGEQQVCLISGDQKSYLHISQIKSGDKIMVGEGQIIPLNGVLKSSHSYFNESLITGESNPVLRETGDAVRSGAKNLSHDIFLQVSEEEFSNSFHDYVAGIKIGSASLEKYAKFGSTYSVVLSVLLILLSVLFWINEPSTIGYEKILALMIICCPCALGIGMPLATIIKTKMLAKKGISIRKTNVFEKFSSLKTLLFDKTGTLTTGEYRVLNVTGERFYLSHLVALEKRSEHPVGVFLAEHFQTAENLSLDIKDFKETPGVGISGIIDNHLYSVCSNDEGEILLLKDQTMILKIEMSEVYDYENIKLLEELSTQYHIKILTGDKKTNVEKFKKSISHIPSIIVHGGLSPEDKVTYLNKEKESLYIGDGLNDILVMKEAELSISLNASPLVDDLCDIVFFRGGLKKLSILFKELNHLQKSIRSIITISIIYNIVGITLVTLGVTGPLISAILMPLSSLFVVGFTFFKLREVY